LSEDELADLRNREMGFVWQLHHLLPEFTAAENVGFPLRLRGAGAAEARERASRLLEEVGLQARQDHRPGQLSGGEQQRVALARALANEPSLLLADEPTGNLDQGTGDMVFALIEQLHQQHNLTSVIVSHNPAFARRCHRVVELSGGRLRQVSG
jgi:lipoprotein-releasing system ATP-binding protein